MIEIQAPASKSYAQRAIVCAALAVGESLLRGVGSSEDVHSAIGACRSLGAMIERVGDDLQVVSDGKLHGGRIEVGQSGLLTRLIAPLAAIADGRSEIIGRATLNSRPMHSLIDTLDRAGAEVNSLDGHLPLTIDGTANVARSIKIDGSDGSQVLSGLLMMTPLLKNETVIEVENLRSRPYIDMTISVLNDFGIQIENHHYKQFIICGDQRYRAINYRVEGDWSGASYFLVADAIAGGGKIEVTGLNARSLQADRSILEALDQAKKRRAFEFDATHCPDLFPSLVVLASRCEGESRIVGTSRLAHKESARDIVLREQWRKFNVEIDLSTPNIMVVKGLGDHHIDQTDPIDPCGDHRIAMAAAIMGRGVQISSPEVVNKSYPQFWNDYHRIEHLLEFVKH